MNKIEDPNITISQLIDFSSENRKIGEKSGAQKLSEFLHSAANFEAVVDLVQEVVRERPIHVLYELPAETIEATDRITAIRELGRSQARRVAYARFGPEDNDLPRGAAVAEILNNSNFEWDEQHRYHKFETEILEAGVHAGQDVSIILSNVHNLSETAREFLLEKVTGLNLITKGGPREKKPVNVELIATADPTKFPEIQEWRTLFRKPQEAHFEVSERTARNTAEVMRSAIDTLQTADSVDIVLPGQSGKSTVASVLRNQQKETVFVISIDKLLKTYKKPEDIKWPDPRPGQVVFIDNAELLPDDPRLKEGLVWFYGKNSVAFMYKDNPKDTIVFGQ